MMPLSRCILGVDEAGRGPLAGPVAVGVVAVVEGFDVAREFPGVADSKVLSERKREVLFAMLEARVARGDARYVVEWGNEDEIDTRGIAVVVREAVARGVNAFTSTSFGTGALDTEAVEVLLDGALRAPAEYRQQTIVGGDASIPLISLASIAAKISRDRLMCDLALCYPAYDFARHKGYGTRAHYDALRLHGLCAIHRRSFIHLDRARAEE